MFLLYFLYFCLIFQAPSPSPSALPHASLREPAQLLGAYLPSPQKVEKSYQQYSKKGIDIIYCYYNLLCLVYCCCFRFIFLLRVLLLLFTVYCLCQNCFCFFFCFFFFFFVLTLLCASRRSSFKRTARPAGAGGRSVGGRRPRR